IRLQYSGKNPPYFGSYRGKILSDQRHTHTMLVRTGTKEEYPSLQTAAYTRLSVRYSETRIFTAVTEHEKI
ncbi:MAG: hypothetical protein ACLT46_15395, partial [Hungatella sp.]